MKIDNIAEFIPGNNAFTIYIKRNGSPVWDPVVPAPQNNPAFTGLAYYFSMNNGNQSMTIIEAPDGFDLIDTPDIKIVY